MAPDMSNTSSAARTIRFIAFSLPGMAPGAIASIPAS
jgi:hypothetical protein